MRLGLASMRIPIMLVMVVLVGQVPLVGCASKDIEGRVDDPWKRPISDVVVTIENTTLSVKTDSRGGYSISYVPGAFKVVFAKAGFTTDELNLDVPTRVRYPAKTIVLYPVPPGQGMYLFADSGLVKLEPSTCRNVAGASKLGSPTHHFYRVSNNPGPSIRAGTVRFIDKIPKRIMVYRINEDGLIQHYSFNYPTTKYYYNGRRGDTETRRVGREGLIMRSLDLEPGSYAWAVEVGTMTDQIGVATDQPVFQFQVEPSSSKD